MGDPPMIYDPPPRSNFVQGASIAVGLAGLAMTAAGATQSTAETALQLGHHAVVQAGLMLGFATVPGSLRWGIALTAVSLALNIYSFWLRSQSRSQLDRSQLAEKDKPTGATSG
jgi:hypothetical protein